MAEEEQIKIAKVFDEKGLSFPRLKSLLALAEAGSVTAAAKALNRHYSGVSEQILDLEKFFHCKLRQNTEKTTGLSPEGKELASLVGRQIKELTSFRDKYTETLHSVRLAAGDSFLHSVVLPTLNTIQNKFSYTKISVADHRTFEIIQGLQNFSIDLGVVRKTFVPLKRRKKAKINSLASKVIGKYKYCAFIPEKLWEMAKGNDEKVFNLPFAMIQDHWNTDFAILAEKKGIGFGNIKVFCETFTHVIQLVRTGHYVGILPAFCRSLLPEAHCYQPSFLKEHKYEMVLAWNTSLLKINPLFESFIACAVKEFRKGFRFPSIAP